ncbi:MAG: patatin family protein [Bacilli bacterium]|nr:patatin family protein [Bacilli bacterium]
MRGVYTAGVLDFFMEKNLKFLNVIGVSSGACNAVSYKSWQPRRNIEIYTTYALDKRYCSIRSLLRHGNIFGFDFIFNVLPKELVYFDYDSYNQSPIEVEVVVTNIETGEPEYYPIKNMEVDLPYLRASCSIPAVSRIVIYQGKKMLDGSVSDSIPINYSIKSGYDKQVVVLTRDKSYRKKRLRSVQMLRARYPRYPQLTYAVYNRYLKYNQTLEMIEKLSLEKKVFVIRPEEVVTVRRFEKDCNNLMRFYHQGYNDAENRFEDLLTFITSADNVISG